MMRLPPLSASDDDTVTIDVEIAPLQAPLPAPPPGGGLPDWLPVTGAEPVWFLAAAGAATVLAGAVFLARQRQDQRRRSGG